MRPRIDELAGYKVIKFIIYKHDNRIGKLVERIFDGKRYLTLLVSELAFTDAILAVIDEDLWLSRSLDPHYIDGKIEIVRKVRLDDKGRRLFIPTISLPFGDHLVEMSYTATSLVVSFPVSKFVEGAIDHLRKNPVFNLADTGEQGEKFKEKWQKMLKSLES